MQPLPTYPPVPSLPQFDWFFLRPFMIRAAVLAIITVAVALLIGIVHWTFIDSLTNAQARLQMRPQSLVAMMIFIIAAAIALLMLGLYGLMAVSRWGKARLAVDRAAQSPRFFIGAHAELRALQVWSSIAFVTYLLPLGLPATLGWDAQMVSLETFTGTLSPPALVQFFLYLICAGAGLTAMAARRARMEVRLWQQGPSQPGFHADVSSPVAPMAMAGPTLPTGTATLAYARDSSAPSAESVSAATAWSPVVSVGLLLLTALLATHMWILYPIREAFTGTRIWRQIYNEHQWVPIVEKDNGEPASGPSWGWRNSDRSSGRTETSAAAGTAGVITVGSFIALLVLQGIVLVWAIVCIVGGPRLRSAAVGVGWFALGVVVVGLLAHLFLAYMFRGAPEKLFTLTTLGQSIQGRRTEFFDEMATPTDFALRQAVIPIVMLVVLTRESVKPLFAPGDRGAGNA